MSGGGRVAFATEELFPFGPGGIGRLVHHLTRQALAARTFSLKKRLIYDLHLSENEIRVLWAWRLASDQKLLKPENQTPPRSRC